MSGKRLTAEALGATIDHLFVRNPQTKMAFTLREIADAIWLTPTMLEESWIHGLLTPARHVLEDGKHRETFIPVTDYYFRNFDDDNQPRNGLQAQRCIAGWGRAHRTAGIRRLRVRYDNTNDRLSHLWVERLKRASCAAVKRFSGRVIIAFDNRAMTKERAATHLTAATLLAMPDDKAALRKLLPKGVRHDQIKITISGKGKSLKDIQRR